MRSLRTAIAAVACLAALAACNPSTTTAPTGKLTLFATFDDAQDLTPGHDVQSSNVTVGSVREISLDGYQAKVRMSISDGRDIPVGTRAVIRRTSLLGEYYVDLVFPDSFDPEAGPFLENRAEITDTETQDDIEQLAEEASGVVGAFAGTDLGGAVRAGAIALDGRGDTLNRIIAEASRVTGAVATQTEAIARTVDSFGRIGAALAPKRDEIAGLVDELGRATGLVAGSRDRIVAAVEALVDLATATNETVLVPHADELATLLAEANPLLRFLADRSDVLAGLITDLLRFTELLPRAMNNGQILLLAWAFLEPAALQQTAYSGAMPLDALSRFVRSVA